MVQAGKKGETLVPPTPGLKDQNPRGPRASISPENVTKGKLPREKKGIWEGI